MSEPALDLHEWESEWASLEEDIAETWEAGAELVRKLDDPGEDVEREDIVDAIENYRLLFETLVTERAPP